MLLLFAHDMRKGVPKIAALQRTLTMLEAILADNGQSSVAAIARAVDIPVATAHRQVATLVAEEYLTTSKHGRHVAGARLLGLLHRLDEKQIVANVAAPVLDRLARRVRSIVQLGTLENDMVTYRIKTGQGSGRLFTKVDMQLEAYCSGIGKVLLANLADAERDAYLANGPFVALTSRTIVDPARLADTLVQVRRQDYAIDHGEIADGLVCMAVPIRNHTGVVLAAISVSQSETAPHRMAEQDLLPLLREAAHAIEGAAFGSPSH